MKMLVFVLIVIGSVCLGVGFKSEYQKGRFIQAIVIGTTTKSEVISVLGAPQQIEGISYHSVSPYTSVFYFKGSQSVFLGRLEDGILIFFDKDEIVCDFFRIGL
jgi:hypothetical protein